MATAILGLAALLHASALAFQTLKYVGVAYFLYMAWNALRERSALRVEQKVGARSAAQTSPLAFLQYYLAAAVVIVRVTQDTGWVVGVELSLRADTFGSPKGAAAQVAGRTAAFRRGVDPSGLSTDIPSRESEGA